jgi:hypothetical protein
MAGRGPLPKSDEARQRTNTPTFETVVLGSAPAKTVAPKIPRAAWRKLHIETRAWWDDLLASPQASQFIRTDWRRLRMAVLPVVERLNRAVDAGDDALIVALARELRQQERDFGLTPDSRQRMRWVMQDPAKAPADTGGSEPARPRTTRADPRLELVKPE